MKSGYPKRVSEVFATWESEVKAAFGCKLNHY